jgi:hypothetical protein
MRKALNPEIALGFLIATVLWIGVLGWQASYAPTDSEKRQCEETAHKSGHKSEECKTIWERTTSDPVAFFTLWLVIFTAGLTVSTIMLWRAGEKQFRHARIASMRQSRDMQASVAAAAESNRISAEGFHASQRAWVTEASIAASDLVWDEEGGHLTIKTAVKNIGIAPAQDVTIQAKTYVRTKSGFAGSIAEAMKEPTSAAVGHLLFPNGDFAPSKRLTLTHEQIDEFRKPSDPARNQLTVDIAIIVRYLSTMDRKHAQTIRFYSLQMIPEYSDDEIIHPIPINFDEDVPQARLFLTHHWLPSYAD